jgi:hypothetical protein
MLILTYFELNPDLDPSEIAQVGATLIKKGMVGIPGQKMLAWYITTGYWGFVLTEMDNETTAMKATNAWRIAKPGIFKVWKTGPAMKSEEAIPMLMKMGEEFKK